MKIKIVLILCAFIAFNPLNGQGIEFFNGTWAEAKAKAKESGKLLFVDCYTSWCGPCKRMASQIFPLENVGMFYNANFINYKIDMEKGEGPSIGQQYKIRAYPTFIFVDGDGKLVFTKVGGAGEKDFIDVGRTAVSKFDLSPQFAAKYDAGDRSPELLYNYIKALNASGKSSLKIANEYLSDAKNAGSEYYYKIIYEATQASDSKPFEYLVKNEKAMTKYYTSVQLDQKKYNALRRTADKSFEFQATELKTEALKTAKVVLSKDQYKYFVLESELYDAHAGNNGAAVLIQADKLADALTPNAPSDKQAILKLLNNNYKNTPGADKVIRKWYGKIADISGDPSDRLNYAIYLAGIKENDMALAEAKKAKSAAEKQKLDTTKYDNVILKISSM